MAFSWAEGRYVLRRVVYLTLRAVATALRPRTWMQHYGLYFVTVYSFSSAMAAITRSLSWTTNECMNGGRSLNLLCLWSHITSLPCTSVFKTSHINASTCINLQFNSGLIVGNSSYMQPRVLYIKSSDSNLISARLSWATWQRHTYFSTRDHWYWQSLKKL